MARYQYETSPRKLEPDFIPNRISKKSQDLQRERIKRKNKTRSKRKSKTKKSYSCIKEKSCCIYCFNFCYAISR